MIRNRRPSARGATNNDSALSRGRPERHRSYVFLYWYSADQGTTIATGISQWNDLSGNARNVTQATGANQPTLTASDAAYNGKQTVNGNGSQWLTGAGWGAIAQPNTMCATARLTDTAASRCLVDEQTGNQFLQWVSATQIQLNGGATFAPNVAAPASATVLTWQYNSTSSFLRTNGTPTANGDAGTNGNDGVNIFQFHGAVNRWIGSMSELVGYAGSLNTSAMVRLEHYMGARYGVAA